MQAKHIQDQSSSSDDISSTEGTFVPRKSITFDAVALAFQLPLKPAQLSLALEIAAHGRPDGTNCRAGQRRLASGAGMSRDAAGNHIRAMRKSGVIVKTGEYANDPTDPDNVSDIIAINLPKALPADVSITMLAVGFHYDLPPLARAVFLAHCEVAGHDGRTWNRCPTEEALARRFQVNVRSIRRACLWLRGFRDGERSGPMLLYRLDGHAAPGKAIHYDVSLGRAGTVLVEAYLGKQYMAARRAKEALILPDPKITGQIATGNTGQIAFQSPDKKPHYQAPEYTKNKEVYQVLQHETCRQNLQGEGCFAEGVGSSETHVSEQDQGRKQDALGVTETVEAVAAHPQASPGWQTPKPTLWEPKPKPLNISEVYTDRIPELAELWEPSGDDRRYAMRQGLSHGRINRLADNFADYYINGCIKERAPGWSFSWQRWVLDEVERIPPSELKPIGA